MPFCGRTCIQLPGLFMPISLYYWRVCLQNSFLLQLLFRDKILFLNFPSSPFPSPQPHQLSEFLHDNLMNLEFPIYRCFCCCYSFVVVAVVFCLFLVVVVCFLFDWLFFFLGLDKVHSLFQSCTSLACSILAISYSVH